MHKEIILDNNMTVIYECLSHLKSVSFGVWIGVGSRYEIKKYNGISHFIEHMVFKGTTNRSARDIACAIDRIGGQINAFTGKDCTCFYTKTLDSDLETAVEILSDMLFNSTFDPVHISTEKKVVLEEIKMYEDDPEELVHDLLIEDVWSEGPLGFPILGTRESLKNITREAIKDHMDTYYIPDNCVISVVGNFDEDHLIEIINKYFGAWKPLTYCRLAKEKPRFKRNFIYRNKDTKQTHLCIGFKGLPLGDERVFSLLVLNNIIGGGMSSRFFQTMREELGLVYSIYSFPTAFRDCGMVTIYAAANPEKVPLIIDKISFEIRNILKNGISATELSNSKSQLKGNYILGLDSTSGRMASLGKSRIITGKVRTTENVLESIDAIKESDILELAEYIFFGSDVGIVALGDTPISQSIMDYLKF